MNRAWHEGDGLFETILVRDGTPFFVDAHVARLASSAERLRLPPPPEGLAAECRDRARDFRGAGRMRIIHEAGTTSITLDPFDGYPPEIREKGVDVILAPGHPLGTAAGHKALPYTPLLDARRAAANRGAFDAIFLDADGALLEGSASNLFVVADDALLTPPLTRPILPGVTRAKALEAATSAGIAVREQDLRPADLFAAEEAFLTGSLMEIVPIHAVDGTPLSQGSIASRLREDLFGN